MFKFFFIFLFLLISQTKSNLCEEYISNSLNESDLINKIETNFEKIKNSSLNCIESLLRTSNYKTLETYVKLLNSNGIRFRENLSNTINSLQKKLEDIMNKYKFDENDYQIVSPAFQWAQSLSTIFIEVKFAHRHDSPGCLEINNLNIEINGNNIRLIAYCISTDIPIKFDLNLNCLFDFDKEKSSFSSGSVGRYQLTLKKKEVKYWERLLFDSKESFANMKTWYEMRNKYLEELKDYEKIESDDDDKTFEDIEKEFLEMSKKKKRKKKRKKKIKIQIYKI
jgi:hypothetical protein